MATAYIGEIRMVGFNFAPEGWLFCQGQLVSIQDYDTLFTLLGTTYGGDGQSTFALPDLRGRAPLHHGSAAGATYVLGQLGGSETVTLTANQIASHIHSVGATAGSGGSSSPAGQTFAGSTTGQYATPGSLTSGPILGPSSGGQPHSNLMPYQTVNFIISAFGIYPSQN